MGSELLKDEASVSLELSTSLKPPAVTKELPIPDPSQSVSVAKRGTYFASKRPTSFKDVIVFCYRNYAEFDGRASRSEFWKWYLYVLVLLFGTFFVIVLSAIGIPEVLGLGPLAMLLISITHLIPTLACGVRRLHDTGRPAYGLCVALIPVLGSLVLLFWLLQPSMRTVGSDAIVNGGNGSEFNYEEDLLESRGAEAIICNSKNRESTLRVIAGITLLFVAIVVASVLVTTFQLQKTVEQIESAEWSLENYNKQHFQLKEQLVASYGTVSYGEGFSQFQSQGSSLAGLELSAIISHHEAIKQVAVPFWDGRTNKLRSFYLFHNEAWQELVRQRISDPNSGSWSDVIASWNEFCGRIKHGKPLVSPGSINSRLDALCE